LVYGEIERQSPNNLTPLEAFSLHAFFGQLRQIQDVWQTIAPALRQLESPIYRRYVNTFQDFKLNMLIRMHVETIAARQYHNQGNLLGH
jgi:hypothetical protein